MRLSQFLRILWARRVVVLACTIGALLAAFLVVTLIPPRYEAQSRLLLDVSRPDPVSGDQVAPTFARAFSKTQENLLKDSRVVRPVVDRLRLTSNDHFRAMYEARGRSDLTLQDFIARWIADHTKATLVEGSNILEIEFSAWSPQLARDVANELRRAYVDATSQFKRESARGVAQWYAQQAEAVRLKLAQAEETKTRFERENGLLLAGDNDVDTARLQALAGQTSSPRVTGGPSSAGAATAAQLGTVSAEIVQKSSILGPNHPQMQELLARRNALSQQLAQERASSAPVRVTGADVEEVYAAQRSRVVGQRQKLQHLRQLATEADVLRDEYSRTAARSVTLQQQSEAPGTGITLLGSAVEPSGPAFPKVPLVFATALVLGFGFGVLLAVLLELLNRRVRGREDITSLVSVECIAIIAAPQDRRAGSARLIGSSSS